MADKFTQNGIGFVPPSLDSIEPETTGFTPPPLDSIEPQEQARPKMPPLGVMQGQAFLNPDIAPEVPDGAARPLSPGEFIKNPSGSWSSEMTTTLSDPSLNGGKPTNIPTLWVINGKPTHVSEDEAVKLAAQSKLPFRSYDTMDAANQAAQDRENFWEKITPQQAHLAPSLWAQVDPIYAYNPNQQFTPPPLESIESEPTSNIWSDLGHAASNVIGEGMDFLSNRANELSNEPVDLEHPIMNDQVKQKEQATEGIVKGIGQGALMTAPIIAGVGVGSADALGALIAHPTQPADAAQEGLNAGKLSFNTFMKPLSPIENQLQPSNPAQNAPMEEMGKAYMALPDAFQKVFKDHGASQLVQDYVNLATQGGEILLGSGIGHVANKVGGVFKAKVAEDTGMEPTPPASPNNLPQQDFQTWMDQNGKKLTGDPEKDLDLVNEYESQQSAPEQATTTEANAGVAAKPRIKLKVIQQSIENPKQTVLSEPALAGVQEHVASLDTGAVPNDMVVQHVTSGGENSIWGQYGPGAVTKFARQLSVSKNVQDVAAKGNPDELNALVQKKANAFLTRMQKAADAKPPLFTGVQKLKTQGTGDKSLEFLGLGSVNLKAMNEFERASLADSIAKGETAEILRMHPELQGTGIKDFDGNLIPAYHGTQSEALYAKHDPNAGFKKQGFTSFTFDPNFAESATGFTTHPENKQIPNPRVQRGFLNLRTTWDFKNPKDIDRLLEHDPYLDFLFTNGSEGFPGMFEGKNNETFYYSQAKRSSAQQGTSLLSEIARSPLRGHISELRQALSEGKWIPIEEAHPFIKKLGHDSFTTMEGGAYNIHVFEPDIAFIPHSVAFLNSDNTYGERRFATPGVKFLMTADIKDPLKKALLGAAYKANGITPKTRLDLTPRQKESGFNALKFADYEIRSGDEILQSLFKTDEMGNKVPVEQDIGEAKSDSLAGHLGSLVHRGAQLFKQGSYLGDSGTIVRKIVDGADLMDKMRNKLANEVIHGEAFSQNKLGITGLRLAKRAEAPGSMFYTTHRTKDVKVRQILDFMNENNGVKDYTAAELQEKGFDPRQIMIYKEIRMGLDKALDHYNETAVALGMKPIQKVPGFMPAMWSGDWRVWGTNPDGIRDRVYSAPSMLFGHKIRAEMLKKFPDYRWEVVPAHTGKYDIMAPTEAFQAAHMLFTPGSPLHTAMDKAVDEVFKRQGFRAHSLQRRGVQGAAGTFETGKNLFLRDKRMDNMLKSLESYVTQSYRYTEMRKYMRDILPLLTDGDTAKAYRNQVKIANMYLKAVTGEGTWIPEVVDHALQKVFGVTSNFLISTKLLFYNAGFIASQAFTSLHIIPRLAMLQNLGFKDASVGKALMHGIVDTFLPGKEMTSFLQEAQKLGILDARFVESMSWMLAKRGGPLKATYNILSGTWLANKMDSFTRIHSMMTFYRFFESAGIDKAKAMRMAMKQTDTTMVAYEKFKRIPALNALGPIGDAFAPLTTFMTNDLNAVTLYTIEALKGVKGANPKAFLPLLYKLGIYTSIAGMLGLPGWQDADKLIQLINKTFRTDIATPTEKLLESGWSDAVIYGVPSVYTNMDISGVAGGPSLSLFGSMAGLKNAQQILESIGGVASDELDKLFGLGEGPTKQSLEKAWQSVLPKTWDYMLTKPKGTTTKSGALNYQYGKQDVIPGTNFPVQAVGSKSIAQSKYQKGMEVLREHSANQKNIREQALQRFIDDVVNGQITSEGVDTFVHNYQQRGGGDLSKLNSVLTTQLQQRMLNRVQQMIMKANSQSGALSVQQLQKLHLLEQQIGQLNPQEIGQLGQQLNQQQ